MYLREAIEKALSLIDKDSSDKPKHLTSYFSYERNTGGINCPDRNIVSFKGSRKGVDGEITISMRGMDQERDITLSKVFTTENELIALVEEWKMVVYWWQSRLSFYRLEIGAEYKIIRDFADLDGRNFKNGATFSLLAKDVFSKEEGYTLKTSAGTIRFHGQINSQILENLDLYINEASNA
ncbi:DUF3601 domain-containing protein [Vibrio mimicus]